MTGGLQGNPPTRAWENWRTYGAPRCWAFDFTTKKHCCRIIWPWQRVGGDGESAQHWTCMEREQLTFDEDRVTSED